LRVNSTYHPALHRFAVFTVCCTFLLLIAGALVTSNDAGLSIPDWPLAYGTITPPMVGGIVYEWSHRVAATCVGILTIVLAILLRRHEPRRWVRNLGLIALGAVIAQGVLGGLTVRMLQPPWLSAAHATLAQLFFCSVVGIAVFTSAWWVSDPAPLDNGGSPSLLRIGPWTIAAVFVQLVLGAAFRHKWFGIIPHLIGAVVVTALIFWMAAALKRRFPAHPALTRSRKMLHALIGSQLLLGGAAYWSRLYARSFPQPIPVMVTLTVAHTVVGALVLAATLVVTLMCYRLLRPGRELAAESGASLLRQSASPIGSR
jgi:cytochrome c oxidase assembly protein subunit 15